MENPYSKNERKFKYLLDNLTDAAYETDDLGNITYVNKAAETLTGVTSP